jgi:hypothetical protein
MSDLAITNTGLRRTASEFHDNFILHGEIYNNFNCPFCEIALIPKAIYIEGPQGKSPHFACFPRKPHINGCDGYPIVNGKTNKSNAANNLVKIGQEEFQFPEKLVPRSHQIKKKEDNIFDRIQVINPAEIVRRKREHIGMELGKSIYSSSLIRSFAASYLKVIALCYQYAKKNNLNDQKRASLIKYVLTKMPIELDGCKSNYQAAFKGTKFFNKNSKIWNGNGEVLINQSYLYIKSSQKCEYKAEKDIKELDFYVSIKIPENLESHPKYHKEIINELKRAQERNQKVRWFAYGAPKTPDLSSGREAILLTISVLDHVYISSSNQKKLILKAHD